LSLGSVTASTFYELIGYAGSALIVVSLTRTSILKLRLFGLAGAATFVIYGFLIGAYPVALVNGAIVVVHLFFLRRLLARRDEHFTVLEVDRGSRYLAYFIEFHQEEIGRFQPDFSMGPDGDLVTAFVLRDLVPAGLFIGRRCTDRSVEILLDFVIPQYRDLRIGTFLYSTDSGIFADPECHRAWSRSGNAVHDEYLVKMGFVGANDAQGRPILEKDLRALRSPMRRPR
jgi:hypothetical protein